MKEIQLTQGLVALVDDQDFETLNQWEWHAVKSKRTHYAERRMTVDGKKIHVSMHRFLTKAGSSVLVDHIDHNGLNNQRSNLRACSFAENNANKTGHGMSKYRGVSFKERRVKNKAGNVVSYAYWAVAIQINGKPKHLGYFKNEDDAALAYNKAAITVYGQFANLNVITKEPSIVVAGYDPEIKAVIVQ